MTPVSEEPLPQNELAGDVTMTETTDAMPSHLMEATTAIDTEASMTTGPEPMPAHSVALGFMSQASGFKTEGKMIATASQHCEAPKKKWLYSQLASSQHPVQL